MGVRIKFGDTGKGSCRVVGCPNKAVGWRELTLVWGGQAEPQPSAYCAGHIACDWFDKNWIVGEAYPLAGHEDTEASLWD